MKNIDPDIKKALIFFAVAVIAVVIFKLIFKL